MPSELSGGMVRRVALARAIVRDPMLIIYDEPFVGLDPIALNQILKLIRTLNQTLGITSILVAHELAAVRLVADQIYLIAGGKIVAHGTPDESGAWRYTVDQTVFHRRSRWPGAVPLSGAGLCDAAGPGRSQGMSAVRKPHSLVSRRPGPDRRLRHFPVAHSARDPAQPAPLSRDGAPDLVRRRDEPDHHHDLRLVRRHGARLAAVLRAVDFRRHGCARHGGVAVAVSRARSGGHRAAVRRTRRHLDHRGNRPDAGDRSDRRDGNDGGRSAGLRRCAALYRRHHRDAGAGLRVQRARDSRRASGRRELARPGQRHVLVEHDRRASMSGKT